jgi:F420H(2)-dependent quinone reductase
MRGRGPFRVLNRTLNPALELLLRSPLHPLASGRFALIAYTGRRTGRRYTIPVLYREAGDEVTIAVGWPDRKVWWRNLTGEGGPVELVVAGRRLRGHAVATHEPGRDALVRVKVESRAS